MKEMTLRLYSGPTQVSHGAGLARKAGYKIAFEGTEHVYVAVPVQGDTLDTRIAFVERMKHLAGYGAQIRDTFVPWGS